MRLLDQLAEQRIQQALEAGEFDDLPGAGRRLAFDDDSHIPEDLRLAHRTLKNAGFAPPEVIDRKSIAALSAELDQAGDETERRRIANKLHCLLARLDARRGDRGNLLLQSDYYGRILDRLSDDKC